jgi:negative regulator of flagellin synthesis FlgM
MTISINNVELRTTTGSTPVGNARGKGVESDVRDSPSGSKDVEVSDSARRMAELEAKVAKSTGFDQAKVEAIRLAIERGDYKVDSKQIADQLMKMDWEIAKVSGRLR